MALMVCRNVVAREGRIRQTGLFGCSPWSGRELPARASSCSFAGSSSKSAATAGSHRRVVPVSTRAERKARHKRKR